MNSRGRKDSLNKRILIVGYGILKDTFIVWYSIVWYTYIDCNIHIYIYVYTYTYIYMYTYYKH